MCQSLEEGGKRCRSCSSTVRRGKDRAAYKAKKLSQAGAVSTPSISEMELARAGVGVDEKFDASTSISGSDEFLLRLARVRRDIKSFEALDSSVSLGDVELQVKSIGAMIDARARVLVGVSTDEIALTKKELDQQIVVARKKAKAKLARARKAGLSTDVDTASESSNHSFVAPTDEVARVIREKLFTLESGAPVLGLLGKLKSGYLLALGEARSMEGFIPTSWLKSMGAGLADSSGERGLGYRELVKSLESSITILPMLEREFVTRRAGGGKSKVSEGKVNREKEQLHLEPYGVGEWVVEGYFIDRFIGKVPQNAGGVVSNQGWEVLACGVEAITVERPHLGGLVGLAAGRSRHDDDLRQFTLGLLAVLEA